MRTLQAYINRLDPGLQPLMQQTHPTNGPTSPALHQATAVSSEKKSTKLTPMAPTDVTHKGDRSLTQPALPWAAYSLTTAATNTMWQLKLRGSVSTENATVISAPRLCEFLPAQSHHQSHLRRHLHNSSKARRRTRKSQHHNLRERRSLRKSHRPTIQVRGGVRCMRQSRRDIDIRLG